MSFHTILESLITNLLLSASHRGIAFLQNGWDSNGGKWKTVAISGSTLQSVALSVGDWFFDRVGVSAIDCPYPCDNTCHNLVFK
ncbi:hypothetical protein Syun_021537 [Stephania yunnanensis]|uniref:Pectin acetylesterase n=1 Tax=Stephania yunnanensis TaxID=152371 RepID=A0AAP0IG88_9MAGN